MHAQRFGRKQGAKFHDIHHAVATTAAAAASATSICDVDNDTRDYGGWGVVPDARIPELASEHKIRTWTERAAQPSKDPGHRAYCGNAGGTTDFIVLTTKVYLKRLNNLIEILANSSRRASLAVRPIID